MSHRNINHRPIPGPLYWDHRCRVCSEPVKAHLRWYERLWRRIVALHGKEGMD